MAFSNEIRQGNIVDNWLFQFGFYNGDAQGNGDGGFDAVTQSSSGNANLAKGAISNSAATAIDVDDSSVFTDGDYVEINDGSNPEIVRVNGAPPDADTINVVRAQKGTSATTHADNAALLWHNFFAMSYSDITDNDTFYRGVITSTSSIKESIDLLKGKSATSSITVDIPDFLYQGIPFSREIFGGTRTYMNYTVRVFSKIGSGAKTQIGSFRLTDLSSNGSKLTLSLTSHRPWDLITIPQTKTSTQVYVPIAYGNYAKNATGSNFMSSKDMFPIPNGKYAINDSQYFVYPKSYSSNAVPHFYDQNLDLFIPFTDSAAVTSDTKINANTNSVYIDMERGAFVVRPLNVSGETSGSDGGGVPAGESNTISNIAYATNTDTTQGATVALYPLASTNPSAGANLARGTISFDIPTMDGERDPLANYYLYIKARVSLDHQSGDTSIRILVGGNSGTEVIIQEDADGNTDTSGHTIGGVSGYSRVDISSMSTINVVVESKTLATTGGSAENGVQVSSSATIYDIAIQMTAKNDIANEKLASADKLSNLEFAYTGADGLTESWTGSSNAITEIHEAHRDLLIRYCGVTTDTPDGWGNGTNDNLLDHAKDWQIRYWLTKPKKLKDVLEMLQMEGGFVFRFKNDGQPSYVFVRDNYDAVDPDHTLTKQDISDVVVRPSRFNELITQQDISYRKHPAGNDYFTDITFSNSASRKKYNIKSKENIRKINLDAYVGDHANENDIPDAATTNPNDDWATYYDNLYGAVFIKVECTVVNSKFYHLEVGDVIGFSDMFPATPYSHNSASWTANSMKFIIISTVRKLGELKIKVREI